MWHRFREWLRDRVVNLLLDLLCWVLPAGKRFELTIEPVDKSGSMLAAILRERDGQG